LGIFSGERLYGEHSGHIMYFVMFPDWLLIENICLGLLGVIISSLTYFQKIKIRVGYLLILLLLIMSFVSDYLG
jgi:hypothetical protein